MKNTLLLLILFPLLSFGQKTNDTSADSSTLTAFDYFERGTANFNLSYYKDAVDDYSKAIELNPDFADAYCYRAAAYLNSRIHTNLSLDVAYVAISDLSEAIRLNPNLADAYLLRGFIYSLELPYCRDLEKACDLEKAFDLEKPFGLLKESYSDRCECYDLLCK